MDYGKYLSEDKIIVTNKDYYTDSGGYQNEKAFWDFVSSLTEQDRMYLLCIDVDLSPSNAKSIGYGNLVLRMLFTRIREVFPIFRIRGNKFNIFVPDDRVNEAQEIIDSDNSEFFVIHGEILTDKFVSHDNVNELIAEGIKKMFTEQDRQDPEMIIGDKGNTPVWQQETPTKKYIAEMWYATIRFREKKPIVRELIAYVFPTEFKPPMAMLHTIVVLDNMIEAKLYEGTVVQIPLDGMRISISARFDHDNHINISWFKANGSEGEIEADMEIHEGNSIPANFGKRIGQTKEIYPVKLNSQGLYEYVLFDKKAVYPAKKATYVENGIVQGKQGEYEVHRDSTVIELVKM